jgi:antitoxin (DNA-binding transcriptional repressor) of toxin-antitoxin stability system
LRFRQFRRPAQGQNDKAYALLKSAGATFPTDKTPWVRMAQMRFDSTDYGQAIVDALEALERDPDDTLANSIVAVSGLRVTSKALADLSQKNNLSGNVRTEAQELAKLLRSSLGEEVLVANGGRPAARPRPAMGPEEDDRGPAAGPRRQQRPLRRAQIDTQPSLEPTCPRTKACRNACRKCARRACR